MRFLHMHANLNTLRALVDALGEHGDRPALVVPGKDRPEQWSYRELSARARAFAGGLAQAGVARGTPVVLCAPNSPEWVVTCCALFLVGALVVPIDAQMPDEDLRHVLRDCEGRWVITTRVLGERVRRLQSEVQSDRTLTTVLLDVPEGHADAWTRYQQADAMHRDAPEPDDTALLFYTSGTTGRPKGVPLSHRNLLANLSSVLSLNVVADDDRLFVPLPLHHVYPFSLGMLLALARGLPMGLTGRTTGPEIAKGLRQTEATVILAVPGLYAALFAAIEQRIRRQGRWLLLPFRMALRLSTVMRRGLGVRAGARLFAGLRRRVAPRLRTMVSGGAALDPDLGWRLEGLGWTVGTGYGLTETSPILTLNEPGRGHLDSAGHPLPGVQLRIDAPAPGTEHGEVLAKGPNVFSGYWRLPDATRRAFSEDGYFRTGDLGSLKDGYLYLAGRASSRIVLAGGERISPDVVEEVLGRGSHVKEAAVLPVEGKLVALLVPEERERAKDASLSQAVEQDFERQCRELPPHDRPARFRLHRGTLPRTRLGKLRRHKLPALYEEAGRAESAPPSTGPMAAEEMAPDDQALVGHPAGARVWGWLGKRFPDAPLSPETRLRQDLGVDSLEWVSMTLELQDAAGVLLDQDVVDRLETVRDLLAAVVESADGAGREEVPHLLAQLRDDPARLLDETQLDWLRGPAPTARKVGTGLFRLNRAILRRLVRLSIRGLEHLPDKGPVVWAPNHVSLVDPLALAAALPPDHLHGTWWAGWSEIMFRNPVMRLLSRATRVVPIDPRKSPFANLALAAALVRQGSSLVWFPEGGRSPTGTLQRFHPGIGLLLLAQRVPVVPVWIEGTREVLPFGGRLPRPRPVSVTFGRALEVDALREGAVDQEQESQRIADALRDHVAHLSPKGPPREHLPVTRRPLA